MSDKRPEQGRGGGGGEGGAARCCAAPQVKRCHGGKGGRTLMAPAGGRDTGEGRSADTSQAPHSRRRHRSAAVRQIYRRRRQRQPRTGDNSIMCAHLRRLPSRTHGAGATSTSRPELIIKSKNVPGCLDAVCLSDFLPDASANVPQSTTLPTPPPTLLPFNPLCPTSTHAAVSFQR